MKDSSVTEEMVLKAFKAPKVSKWFQQFDTTKATLVNVEVRDALQLGLIKDPTDSRYRNAQFIVQ